jgi:hypothetical protein
MNAIEKNKIQSLLNAYIAGFASANEAAKTLKDVSSGTISQIRSGKWELVSDRMWLNIAKQMGNRPSEWFNVKTANYETVWGLLADAQAESRVHAITGGAGWGKDTAIKDYRSTFDSVYVINCAEYFNKKYFMTELLRLMGKQVSGTVPEMVERAIRHINMTPCPLIVLNEVDKLKDETLYFFITFYNLTEDKCGIAALATDQLEKRISRGLFLNKKGYQEIFSRFGRRFIELEKPSKADVRLICEANGVTDALKITEIFNSCEGDLRRVKKLVQNERRKAQPVNEEAVA